MLGWLAVWGVANAVGFVFKPILEDLAKDATKDWAKDFFKDSLKHVLRLPPKQPLEIAAGKALKEFLQIVQQGLDDADLSEAELQQYIKPLKQFIHQKSVKEILSSAFKDDCQVIDARELAKTWDSLQLVPLPDEFDWEQAAKRYLKKVRALIKESDELRPLLDSQNLEAAQNSLKEIAGIPPGFDLLRYQEGTREQYGNLRLDSLDTSGYAYNEVKLWRIFIAQSVREVHEVLPQVHELPKEYQRRLRASNQMEQEISVEELERHRQIYSQQPISSVFDIVNDKQTYQHLVILGDPGSGKSTLLQYLALNWAPTESPLTTSSHFQFLC